MRQTASGATSVSATLIGLPFLMTFPFDLSHQALCELVAQRLDQYIVTGSWMNPIYGRSAPSSNAAPRCMFVNQGIINTRMSSSSSYSSQYHHHAASSNSGGSGGSSTSAMRTPANLSSFSGSSLGGSPYIVPSHSTPSQPINMPGDKSPSEKMFSFSLRFANRPGTGCGRCDVLTCRGCPFEGIMPAEPLKPGQTIAIDMHQPCYWMVWVGCANDCQRACY